MDKVKSVGRQTVRQEQGRPLDKHSIVYLVLVLHGIGSLMPWNMFINAQAYFRYYKLAPPSNSTYNADQILEPDPTIANIRENFLSYLCVAAQVPNLLFSGVNLIVNIGSDGLASRVNITLAVEALIFTFTIILAVVDCSAWRLTFFYITLISVVILNMASGIYQNCVFGLGAKFPSTYTNAVLIGSNISGTFTSTVNLLSIWLAPADQEAAIYYFVTALVTIIACIVSFNLLKRNRFYRYYCGTSRKVYNDPDNGVDHDESVTELVERQLPGSIRPNKKVPLSDLPDAFKETVDAFTPKSQESAENNSLNNQLRLNRLVLAKCWTHCLNTFLVFFVTLALFPTVLADISQDKGYLSAKYFTPFACFFVFNVFALVGNLISNYTSWPGRDRVWILVYARFLFIPFYLFCNYRLDIRHWPAIITGEKIYILGTIVFAASHGYLSSVCMMFASSGLKPDEAMRAGMLAAFFLVLAIFVGISSSFIWPWIIQLG